MAPIAAPLVTTTLITAHLIGLDGADSGPSLITIGPSGDIESIRPHDPAAPDGAPALTAIPLLADAHSHLGISDGVVDDPRFHTLDHVDAQLQHLAACGIGHIHSLGTDQRWLQERLQRRLAAREPGEKAYGYSAGIGFGAVNGWPPDLTYPETRFRPLSPALARKQVVDLAKLGCKTLKIWVDDFGGKVPKVPLDVMHAIVDEARRCGIVTFAHVHFHEDAEALVGMGIGVLAHSVRDRLMSSELIAGMAERDVALVPTLSREEGEVAFSLARNPYMDNAFFLASEAALVGRLRGKNFSEDPEKPAKRLSIALENLARVHAAGVAVGMGTDSGFKMKLQGFAQHRELQLMEQAGMSPAACLRSALGVNQRLFASGMTAIAVGQPASFFIVEGNPLDDIRATETIREVWVGGKRVNGSI